MKYSAVVLMVLVCSFAIGQCSTLAVSGSVNPGDTVTIAVTGAAPLSLVFIVAGDPGSTTLNLGFLGTLSLDVAAPFDLLLPIGISDANGDASLAFGVPSGLPPNILPDLTLTLQALSASFQFGGGPPFIDFCTSNTAPLTVGGG